MDLDVVVDAAERWTSPRIKTWFPSFRSNLTTWLEPSVALVGDAEWGAQIRDLVQLPIDDPLEWANRRIDLADGEWAIAGIRFRGRDVEKPFVDLIGTSLRPAADGLQRLTEVLPHFAPFRPLALRVYAPEPLRTVDAANSAGEYNGRATVDLLVVAGLLPALQHPPSGEAHGEVVLANVDPDAAAQRVKTIYNELAVSRPALLSWAQPADHETLSEAADAGLLFDIQVDGVSSGVVAAAREDAYGMCGYSIQEICLDADHRGQHIAATALRHLAGRLSGDPEVLWGHIHPDNLPSLHNAIAVGREIVGGHIWVTPDGYPGMPD